MRVMCYGEVMNNREIDVLVAEHCMGWVWRTRKNDTLSWLFPPHAIERQTRGGEYPCVELGPSGIVGPFHKEEVFGSHRQSGTIPRYSTDPTASKQLRDKRRAEGWNIMMFDECGRIRVTMYRPADKIDYAAVSDTEEMSVAFATLATVGIQLDNQT